MIYLQFFIFNTLLSSFFIFSQKIFENNFAIANAFLWTFLLVALSLGAAVYSRFSSKLDSALHWLFPLGLLYLLIGNVIFLKINPWRNFPTFLYFETIFFYNFVLTILGLIVFAPPYFILGIMEMHVYQNVSNVDRNGRWTFYLFGILGLLSGLILHAYLLPIPSPFWLGISLLLLFLMYSAISPLHLEWRSIFITAVAFFVMTQMQLYVRNPAGALFQSDKSLGAVKIKVDNWTRNNRLTIIESKINIIGFYNSIFHWRYFLKDHRENIDYFVAEILPEGATIAVLGVGGGAQLRPLLMNNPCRIYAIDIVPNLFNTMTELGIKVFDDPRVNPVLKDGRKFIKESTEQFDLIYLPLTESAFKLNKNLFEPSNLLFTLEAINIYRDKLKPEGVIAISKPNRLVHQRHFFENYVATLKQAGFEVAAYRSKEKRLLIASRNVATFIRANKSLENFPSLSSDTINTSRSGSIISDNKPFYASVMYSSRTLYIIWLWVLGSAIIIGLFLKRLFLNNQLFLPPLFCGINYTLLLLAFQLILFSLISNPLDAAIIGNLLFLIFLWLGALIYERKMLLLAVLLSCAGVSFILKIPHPFPILIMMTICSGGFFPHLLHFYYSREKIPFLLILDGLGAAVAGVIYLLVPTIWGIHIFLFLCIAIFMATLYCIIGFTNQRISN